MKYAECNEKHEKQLVSDEQSATDHMMEIDFVQIESQGGGSSMRNELKSTY